MKSLIEIQNEVVARYRIKLDEHSTCYGRMHAHVKERRICKWHQKSSLECTFDLFHEIGHCETTKSSMRRAESEYFATCWAIDMMKEYRLKIPENCLMRFQRYVLSEIARGKRRGGQGYAEMNLYRYAGVDKTIEEFKKELSPNWARLINDWV